MATGGWGPGTGPGGQTGHPGGNAGGGQGWGPPPGQPAHNPYGLPPQGGPYGPAAPQQPYPPQNPYPYVPPAPVPSRGRAPRRRSRLWFFSVPYLTGGVIRSAHRVATRLFVQAGEDRIQDRTVDRVQVARTVLGAAATVVLFLAYGTDKGGWQDAAAGSAAQALIAPVLLIVGGPLVILGFIYYAPPHLRPHLRSRLRVPLKAVGWYVTTVVVLGGTLFGIAQVAKTDLGGWQGFCVGIVGLVALAWGLPFFVLASLYSARSAFNTGHVHPMLPPVVTTVFVWVFALFNLIDSGMPEQGPPAVQLCSLLGGPVSVTAVALWELRRMRTRYGVTVRGPAVAPVP
ncbi:hypothetical protein [Streptomyces justiciae]|uniref:hypothetical protein n=1 Tax=Streptomyces justiciae TaxID=2780140 RepID=UPI001881A4A0|nr:hypothetical protein [Streptomyces justiciae]MBE8476151.1 hypothetical protein [Streptomyces justiciae]